MLPEGALPGLAGELRNGLRPGCLWPRLHGCLCLAHVQPCFAPTPAGQRQAAIDSCTKTIELSDRNACDVELLCVG